MTSQARAKLQSKGDADPTVLEALNHHLAVAADLRSQVKQSHWTVVGPNFIALHRLFDEQAELLGAHIDLFAERMRSLQAIPRGTIREAIEESDLPEIEIGELYEEDALRALLERFEHYSHSLTEAIEQAEKAEDMSTQDLFIDVQKEVDLQAYFLRSHLPAQETRSRDGASRNGRSRGS